MADNERSTLIGIEVEVQEVEFYPLPNEREQQQIFGILGVRDDLEKARMLQANRCLEEAQKCEPSSWFLTLFINRLARTAEVPDLVLLEKLLDEYPVMPIQISEEFAFDEHGQVVTEAECVNEDTRVVSQALTIRGIIDSFLDTIGQEIATNRDGVALDFEGWEQSLGLSPVVGRMMRHWSGLSANVNSESPPTKSDYEKAAVDIRELREALDLPTSVAEFMEYWDVIVMQACDEWEGISEQAVRIILSNIMVGMVLRDARLHSIKADVVHPMPIVNFDEEDDLRWGDGTHRRLVFCRGQDEKKLITVRKRMM